MLFSHIEPLTPDDCFTTDVDTQDRLADCYIISVSQVEHSLKKINLKRSVGPDNIPNWILHELAPWLAPPICAIWNSSFRESYVPRLWKSADICPLPKVQPPMRVEKDLLPISLTHALSKGLEWYARDFTMDVIEDLIDTHQYGSAKGSSTLLALVELVHFWLAALEPNGNVVRILLLDFRKAFDRVDHTILLPKRDYPTS